MAFITGSANSAAELRTALINACTANGWVESSGIISKGNAYIKLTAGAQSLIVYGGTGQSGSNITNGPVIPSGGSISTVPGGTELWASAAGCPTVITFPATYHIHVQESPNEVYCWINYSISKWAWCAFGQSPASGVPGTGVWFSGNSPGRNIVSFARIGPTAGAPGGYSECLSSCALFWDTAVGTSNIGFSSGNASFIHHALDGNSWSVSGTAAGALSGVSWAGFPSVACAVLPAAPHIARSPNIWSAESILIPIQPHIYRPSAMVSMVGDIAHARYVRLDNYEAGQVVVLGSDAWRIYPWLERNPAARDAGGLSTAPGRTTHSGTLGIAIRYDGA